jgi:outer membrane protein insertion porin family
VNLPLHTFAVLMTTVLGVASVARADEAARPEGAPTAPLQPPAAADRVGVPLDAVPDPSAPVAAPATAPAPAMSAPTLTEFELDGTLMDPAESIQALLRGIFPAGARFVPSGPADRIGVPLGTLPRLRRALDQVGYDAIVEAVPVAGGVSVHVHLRPYDRVRYLFVSGNGFIRQDEIQRRISIRPGRPLPLPGPDRDAAIERERERVIQYLRSEGYFDATVGIELSSHGFAPAAVDLAIHIHRGPGYPVGPIVVSGNTAIPTPDLERTFRHSDPTQLFTGPEPFKIRRLRDDVAKVTDEYHDLGYLGVRVGSSYDPEHSIDRKNKNVAISLQVVEHKRVSVTFEGNQRRSASALKGQLTFKERGSYDDYEIENSADALQHDYQQRGYFFARVAWRRERLAEDEDRIVFMIDEGPELKVRGVDFTGNRRFSSAELEDVVTVKTFPLLGDIGLGTGGYVTGRQVELDAERLVGFYRGRGFADAQVRGQVSTSPENLGLVGANAASAETVAREASRIYVRFSIEEGPLVRVATETFATTEGGTEPLPYDSTFLGGSLSMRPGEAYIPGLLREDSRRLERLMGDAGYPVATAEPEVERAGDTVRVVWKIKLGPRVMVGPIFVRGNFKTTRETILEQIPLRTGDYLTTTAFERGQRNLSFLQLFNNASPIRFPGKEEHQAVVPMVVEVEERHDQYNVLHLGVGASTEQAPLDSSFPVGGFLRLGYDHRNLLGHGWNLTGNMTYGSPWTFGNSLIRATASILDRRFFGSLFRFDVSSQYYQQATVRLGDIRSWGVSVGFAREMYPGVDANIHYNLRNTTHTEPLSRLSGANERQTSITLDTAVSSVSMGLQWLRLDNRLLPTRGFRIEALAEFATQALSFGYADVSFVKIGLHSTVVVPLAPWLSLRHGFRYDQGFPTGSESLLPKVERYFAGGDTTIRGFKLDRARIEENRIPFVGDVQLVQFRPIGGNLRVLQNLDLQFPILPPWYGSVFWDNGVVADSFIGMTAAQWRHGVGVTPLLFRLPIGDLSFAWGWPLDPGPGDTRIGVFHVNIGLLF